MSVDLEVKPLNNQMKITKLILLCVKMYFLIVDGRIGLRFEIGGSEMTAYGITFLTMPVYWEYIDPLTCALYP